MRRLSTLATLADPDDPLLPPASIDRFVIVNTWHHIEDQPGYLAKLKRMLRPGGAAWFATLRRLRTRAGQCPAAPP